jgi:hypothetical protein
VLEKNFLNLVYLWSVCKTILHIQNILQLLCLKIIIKYFLELNGRCKATDHKCCHRMALLHSNIVCLQHLLNKYNKLTLQYCSKMQMPISLLKKIRLFLNMAIYIMCPIKKLRKDYGILCFLCFVDHASLHNIVNTANQVHNFF